MFNLSSHGQSVYPNIKSAISVLCCVQNLVDFFTVSGPNDTHWGFVTDVARLKFNEVKEYHFN